MSDAPPIVGDWAAFRPKQRARWGIVNGLWRRLRSRNRYRRRRVCHRRWARRVRRRDGRRSRGEDAVLDPERPFVQMRQELTKPGGMIPARREVKAKHA
jgi:hypothetical protein